MTRTALFPLLAAIALVTALFAGPALAISLNEAKAQGLVGERRGSRVAPRRVRLPGADGGCGQRVVSLRKPHEEPRARGAG